MNYSRNFEQCIEIQRGRPAYSIERRARSRKENTHVNSYTEYFDATRKNVYFPSFVFYQICDFYAKAIVIQSQTPMANFQSAYGEITNWWLQSICNNAIINGQQIWRSACSHVLAKLSRYRVDRQASLFRVTWIIPCHGYWSIYDSLPHKCRLNSHALSLPQDVRPDN